MSSDFEPNNHTFRRRSLLVLGGGLVGLGILGGRLFHLQVEEEQYYKDAAQLNQIDQQIILPKRGAILDARGEKIADSIVEYDLYLQARKMDSRQITELFGHLRLDDDEQNAIVEHIFSTRRRPLLLQRNLSPDQYMRLEFHRRSLPNFNVEKQVRRHYFMGANLSPLTGYVGKASREDRADHPHALMEEFRLGKAGIEHEYEAALHGQVGRAEIKVDVHGKHLDRIIRKESKVGDNIRLHVHAELQRFAMQRLSENTSGAVVVMDAETGGVQTLASYPFYDANEFKTAISKKRWQELNADPLNPLTNKAISGLYAPGSTFKPIVALAALRAGIPVHAQHFCNGSISLGNARFHCWKKQGHGIMNMQSAITQSCDVWFYQVARKLGIEKIAEMARELGLGSASDIDLENEKPGLVPDKAWKKKHLNAPFYPGEVVIHGIGQGFTLSTPLQLARAYGCFINGGYLLSPKIVQQIEPSTGLRAQTVTTTRRKVNIPDQHLAIIRKALINAVNIPHGTAWRSRLAKETGFAMAGKTGTTQVRRISRAERATGIRKDNIDWHLRDHALFTGFASVDNPRYVIAVLVEHGVSGARSAAPIARDIFTKMGELGMIS